MSSVSYDKQTISDLMDGRLPWDRAKLIISGYKDEDRFEKVLEILKERVSWKENILLPLTDDLFIVEKEDERIVKCSCGQEFGDYRENWKLKALIHVLNEEELKALYPYYGSPDPSYNEIREYYCPGCGVQLEVESVPFGYPAIFDFLPDIDTFYSEWLNRPLNRRKTFKDLTFDLTRKWGEEGRRKP